MRDSLLIALLAASVHTATSRILHSLPEDPYAFPKYRVAFLNALPVLNDTAQRWLRDGLRGGESEFLDKDWDQRHTPDTSTLPREIGAADTLEESTMSHPDTRSEPSYSLEHMKIGPRDSYICYIPKPLDIPPTAEDSDEIDSGVVTLRSWSLLQPLLGTCLYHRQGWFTYSYCHNKEIRQFKELIQAQPHVSGSYKPEEDPDWEAYTLGKAPATPEPGADLTVAEQNAIAANFELAKGAGSRYLVQKWSDGTFCEQTGKPREVEVQFHCSMTMTDTILFVKETKTCSYVLVINTPRLCGEPGFRSPRDSRSEAVIRCRSIVENDRDVPVLENKYTESEFPFKIPRKSKSIPAPPETQKPSDKHEKHPPRMSGERVDEMVRKALQSFAENKAAGMDGNTPEPQVVVKHTDGDHYVVEFLDEISLDDLQEAESHIDRLTDILRAAGFDIRDTIIDHKDDLDGDEQGDSTSHGQASKKAHPDLHRDEL